MKLLSKTKGNVNLQYFRVMPLHQSRPEMLVRQQI